MRDGGVNGRPNDGYRTDGWGADGGRADGRGTDGGGTDRTDDPDAGLTAEELAAEREAVREALRRLHVPAGDVCAWCAEPFPCPDSRGGN